MLDETAPRRIDLDPAPGSDKAVQAGCKCPVMDNAHGEGRNGKFITDMACPIHGFH